MAKDKSGLNPWLSMWVHPRATIESRIRIPRKYIWVLAWIYGFSSLLSLCQSFPEVLHIGISAILLWTVILAAPWGYVIFAFWSALVLLAGKIFKGQATFLSVRSAYAWSCVPLIANIPIWLILIIFYGNLLFFGLDQGGQVSLPGPSLVLLFLLLSAKLVFSIWSLVVYLQALAEVQGYSMMRSIGTVVLAAIFVLVILYFLWALLTHSMNAAMVSSAGQTADWLNMHWIVQLIP
jgi:hypothetical protein